MPMTPSKYAGTGVIFATCIFTGLVSGCRFGNKVETSQQPSTKVWYYLTEPRQVKVAASLGQVSTEKEIPATQVPSGRAQVMTNPIAVYLEDEETRAGYLVSMDPYTPAAITQSYIETFVETDGSVGVEGKTRPAAAWTDTDACTSTIYVREIGKRHDNTTAQATAQQLKFSSRMKISGRLEMKFEYLQVFEGDCADSFQKMYLCYENRNDCGGANDAQNKELQAIVQDRFNYYIEAGVMTSADIPSVEKLSYTVSYE